ncbi:MAG: tripartite tricarboxylate transporter permease [Candidatus Micrarchaeota archaeon]
MDFLAFLEGILLGIFSGLVPGVHPNTIGALLPQILGGENLAIILIGTLGAYTAVSFLPSIFLGIPEGDTVISLLPGQRLLKEGRAREAVFVVGASLCAAAIISAAAVFVFGRELAGIFPLIKPYTGYILVLFSALLLFRESKFRRIIFAGLVFFLSGILGFVALNSQMKDPLFPLFAGFFAIPALLMHRDFVSGKKEIGENNYSTSFLPYVAIGVVLGAIADFLPGISTPSQLAVFGSLADKNISARNFLAQIAAIEASHSIFSISSASFVGIARVGAVAISSNAYEFGPWDMPIFLGVFLACLGVGAIFILRFGWVFEKVLSKIKFEPVAKILCLYLVVLAFLFEGWYGVLALFVAALIGFLPIMWGVSRTHVMGSIILVSILGAFFG